MRPGDAVRFAMFRGPSGCLFPIATPEEKETDSIVLVDGRVVSDDDGIVEVEYYCEKCGRYFTTCILAFNGEKKIKITLDV